MNFIKVSKLNFKQYRDFGRQNNLHNYPMKVNNIKNINVDARCKMQENAPNIVIQNRIDTNDHQHLQNSKTTYHCRRIQPI